MKKTGYKIEKTEYERSRYEMKKTGYEIKKTGYKIDEDGNNNTHGGAIRNGTPVAARTTEMARGRMTSTTRTIRADASGRGVIYFASMMRSECVSRLTEPNPGAP